MDDLKIYGKNENEVDSLVKTVHQCSSDIGDGIWGFKMRSVNDETRKKG